MNLYPGMKASMGRWNYFVVKMTMRELAESVKSPRTSTTIEPSVRQSNGSSMDVRVKRDIVAYLARQPDRFFSSVVVAALQGNPQWYPVS